MSTCWGTLTRNHEEDVLDTNENKAEPKAGSEEVNTEAKHEELNATVNIDREQRIHSGSGSIITLVQICQEPNPGLPDQTNKSG